MKFKTAMVFFPWPWKAKTIRIYSLSTFPYLINLVIFSTPIFLHQKYFSSSFENSSKFSPFLNDSPHAIIANNWWSHRQWQPNKHLKTKKKKEMKRNGSIYLKYECIIIQIYYLTQHCLGIILIYSFFFPIKTNHHTFLSPVYKFIGGCFSKTW